MSLKEREMRHLIRDACTELSDEQREALLDLLCEIRLGTEVVRLVTEQNTDHADVAMASSWLRVADAYRTWLAASESGS